ncbi:hypothetical protein J0X15_14530 [Roseibium sp. CAU 1637]|uniref:Uncharacterized protein n=1 Tax=Roseibium limicola TaxID=2816037 RepID=A0A939J9J3_9HYPH|nr:hypothetical protein [Roseibium limicola]MBO0346446.1 hypothetical protein [Roseibium limicola]
MMAITGTGLGRFASQAQENSQSSPTNGSSRSWIAELEKAVKTFAHRENATTPDVSSSSALSEIMSRYDLNNISPREIDQLADELSEAGGVSFDGLGLLVTRGEKFRMHMIESLGGDPSTFDPTRRSDLAGSMAEQRDFAAKRGDPLEWYDQTLALFDRLQEARQENATRQPADTMALLDLQSI